MSSCRRTATTSEPSIDFSDNDCDQSRSVSGGRGVHGFAHKAVARVSTADQYCSTKAWASSKVAASHRTTRRG